jgi:YVTN family beta-propeller protein
MGKDYDQFLKELKEEETNYKKEKGGKPALSPYQKIMVGIASLVALCVMSSLLIWIGVQFYPLQQTTPEPAANLAVTSEPTPSPNPTLPPNPSPTILPNPTLPDRNIRTVTDKELDLFTVTDQFTVSRSWRMAFSPEGERLYILHRPSLDDNFRISVVETNSYEVTNIIELEPGYGMMLAPTPDGEKLYVTISAKSGPNLSSGKNRVDIVDTTTLQVTNSLFVGGHERGPTGVVFLHNGKKAYVSHRGSGLLYVIDVEREALIGQIRVGNKPTTMAVTPDDGRVYVVDGRNSNLIAIDTLTDQIIQSIPSTLQATGSHTSITLTPRGHNAYVLHRDDANISILDTDPTSPTYHQIIGKVPTSSMEFRNLAITPDGKYALVTSPSTGIIVADIDPVSPTFHTQVGVISIGYTARYVIFHPSKAQAYVLGEGDTITVIAYTPAP